MIKRTNWLVRVRPVVITVTCILAGLLFSLFSQVRAASTLNNLTWISEAVVSIEMSGNCVVKSLGDQQSVYQDIDHARCIQTAVDAAGQGGSIYFQPGEYRISQPLKPWSSQTWWLPAGAVFRPLSDISVFDIQGLDYLSFNGTLSIRDPDEVTQTAYAIMIDDLAWLTIDSLDIKGYANGVLINGSKGGVHENRFSTINIQNFRNNGLVLSGIGVHDNQFNSVNIVGSDRDGFAGGSGILIATDGTQGGNQFGQVKVLRTNWGVNLPGAYELQINNLMVDTCRSAGLFIGDASQRIAIHNFWSGSNGEGLVIEGRVGQNKAVMIGQAMFVNNHNADYQAKNAEGVQIGLMEPQVNR